MINQEERVAQAFGEAWKAPSPGKLINLIHPETILYQPHIRPIYGKESAYREFQLLLEWMPKFHGTIKHFMAADGVIYIDWIMHFRIGRSEIDVHAIDKMQIVDNLIKERRVYFNTLPLMKSILATPAIWPSYLIYRTAKRNNLSHS